MSSDAENNHTKILPWFIFVNMHHVSITIELLCVIQYENWFYFYTMDVFQKSIQIIYIGSQTLKDAAEFDIGLIYTVWMLNM